MSKQHKTTVGTIQADALAYTAGRDIDLDRALIEADCLGTAAHVRMLAEMPVKPPVLKRDEADRVVRELIDIMRLARAGKFKIKLNDQDVHLAVERALTAKLGDLGKKVHTARSRNDQIAVDLRLYAKEEILSVIDEANRLAEALFRFSKKHASVPMAGRTHMQPAMPSSVGLWSGAYAESLLDDVALLIGAYELNDQCPLGSAAGYGVPLPIDRQWVSDALGFSRPVHNVLHANHGRGKMESIILSAMSQVMLTLSRLAQDLMLFTMPEFGYFELPAELCTGSSIMPQKRNPDVLELVRAKASRVLAHQLAVYDIVKGAPSGYNRDLQEAKEPFMDGLNTTRSSLRIMTLMIKGVKSNKKALLKGFTPGVFATDRALELVGEGMPFRDAYNYVKKHLDELERIDPHEALAKKTHLGAPGGLDDDALKHRLKGAGQFVKEEKRIFYDAMRKLLGVSYPELG